MSNVIHLNVPLNRQPLTQRLAGLVYCFAAERRFGEDVFWLKENAELLSILETSGLRPDPSALMPLEGFYRNVPDRMSFFPQYYRFLLSITLDLEDLGMPGDHGATLVDWAARAGLAEAELSDLQRAEARRLMLRRGVDPMRADPGLNDRLHRFIARSETFALPNKKAAYELTHIVFYLSEYGRRDPQLDDAAFRSLDHAGTLAYLDQNVDLLAEIALALRWAGRRPPVTWEDCVLRETKGFSLIEGDHAQVHDNYHEFFVCNWLAAVTGHKSFLQAPDFCRAEFNRRQVHPGPLRAISEHLFALGDARSSDWTGMRDMIFDGLRPEDQDILQEAEANSASFDAFFEIFARGDHLCAPRMRSVAG